MQSRYKEAGEQDNGEEGNLTTKPSLQGVSGPYVYSRSDVVELQDFPAPA